MKIKSNTPGVFMLALLAMPFQLFQTACKKIDHLTSATPANAKAFTELLNSTSLGALQVFTLAGDGTTTLFNAPGGVATDTAGNTYVADAANNRIRKITETGSISTLAGNGQAGLRDTTAGAAAMFNAPSGVAVDGNGNVYVADKGNHRIRKITPAGAVTTIAGSNSGYAEGPALSTAKFNAPTGVAIDADGNIYVADTKNYRIRLITATAPGQVVTLAGNGTQGSGGGDAAFAQFNKPVGIVLDAASNIYVADSNSIRKISAGQVTTLAGGDAAGFADGNGTAAQFNSPSGIALDTSGNVFVADKGNHRIRQITPAGVVSTLAGKASAGFVDGVPSVALFSSPAGIAINRSGNLFVADQGNQRIREMGFFVIVSTLAGNGTGGYIDGPALSAEFYYTKGITADAFGNIYVTDFWTRRIRKISAGVVSTLAGNGNWGYADGAGTAAMFDNPCDVAADASGNVYVADERNQRIRKITPSGVVSTLAGCSTLGLVDGVGSSAQFRNPSGVATDASGNVYVADAYNHSIRKITPSGVVSTLAGNGTVGFVNGSGSSARFAYPQKLAVDASGNIYVADEGNGYIRKITPNGMVSSLAMVPDPFGVAVDASGNVYVACRSSQRIRKITPSGVVSVLAGSGSELSWGGGFADGPANLARFDGPSGVAIGTDGKLYVADYYNQRIRKIQ